MNERIRQLAEQAGLEFDDDLVLEPEPIYYTTQEDLEKFAQLIVRECAKVADRADENKCEWIGGNILTHFGVEE
jgi:hypothetical protein